MNAIPIPGSTVAKCGVCKCVRILFWHKMLNCLLFGSWTLFSEEVSTVKRRRKRQMHHIFGSRPTSSFFGFLSVSSWLLLQVSTEEVKRFEEMLQEWYDIEEWMRGRWRDRERDGRTDGCCVVILNNTALFVPNRGHREKVSGLEILIAYIWI